MRLLLDTHVVLWWLADDDRLGAGARAAIGSAGTAAAVSAASAWEMSIKAASGKLRLPAGLDSHLGEQGFDELPVTVADGLAAGALPRHHDDPFDRMLIAQARRRDLTVVTADARFEDYDVRLLPAR
ncbi:type II toxin-antitoxin system VapC family toxin [Nakamurella endophytica]|uniref:Twitching motility protein PilT n=1 Tax=Nakamurella endophytica TaxID=1748367 RepID=A0A917SMP0_9ACTN|nr:type II toxin-antitoxin system VapC family toxin [Nakamurella endophytica]GGL89500.1 twitching motility protein PilT [Nakamurella endophytica]